MSRALTAMITMAAIGWHAVVGCCGHHEHEIACYHAGSPSPSHLIQLGHDAGCDDCCAVARDSMRSLPTDARHPELASTSVRAGHQAAIASTCDHDHAGQCAGTECSFSADNIPETLVAFPSYAVPGLSVYLPTPSPTAVGRSFGPGLESSAPPLGNLRLHLALGVLTI